MKLVIILIAIVLILNAFFLWLCCKAAGDYDDWMEENHGEVD